MKKIALILAVILTFTMLLPVAAYAADDDVAEAPEVIEAAADNTTGSKAFAAGIVIMVAASAGAIGMAIVISKCASGMARQPEAAGKINSAMMLGLVFIETAIIYALIVAILIVFVL